MSKELQDRADKIVRELKEALVPLRKELRVLRKSSNK